MVRAYLENISIDGMGILAYKLVEKGMKVKPGSNVQLDFQLFPDNKYTTLKGKIIYLNTIGGFFTTIGIQLFPKAKEAHQLEKYIAHRKQEILEELNLVYWEKIRPRGVENLYF